MYKVNLVMSDMVTQTCNPTLGRLKPECYKPVVSMSYIRPCLKKTQGLGQMA